MIMTLYLKYIADECSRLSLQGHLRDLGVPLWQTLRVSFRLLQRVMKARAVAIGRI